MTEKVELQPWESDAFHVGHRVVDPGPGRFGGATLAPKLDMTYLGRLRRARAVSLAGVKPQEVTLQTERQLPELPEALRTNINHLFDLINGKVKPETDADWDIIEEHDQKLRAVMPPEVFVDVRHRPEETPTGPKPIAGVRAIPTALHEELVTLMRDSEEKQKPSGKPPIGQPDEFTAAEQPTRLISQDQLPVVLGGDGGWPTPHDGRSSAEDYEILGIKKWY